MKEECLILSKFKLSNIDIYKFSEKCKYLTLFVMQVVNFSW
jgi:hypothetical protein